MPTPTQTQADPTIVALAKAIIDKESGGNPNAVGDAGTSIGLAQWHNNNFSAAQKQYGVTGDFKDPTVQKKVLYKTIEDWKNQGLTPYQIASKWNSGQPDNWQPGKHKGVVTIKEKRIPYDTGAYVADVMASFKKYRSDIPKVPITPKQPNPSPSTFSGAMGTPIANAQQATGQPSPQNVPQKTFSNALTKMDASGQQGANLVKGAANFLTSSEQGLGNAIAGVVGAPAAQTNADQMNAQKNANLQVAITQRNKLKAAGKDTTKIDQMITELNSGTATAADTLPQINTTGTDVALSAAGTAADIASFGTYGAGTKAMSAGKLAKTLAQEPSLVKAAGSVVSSIGESQAKKEVAKIAEVVGPKLTPTSAAKALVKQGTKKVGLLRRTVLNPSSKTQSIVSAVKKFVPDFNPKGLLSDNIEKTRRAVSKSVSELAIRVEKEGKNIAIPIREVESKIKNALQVPEIRIAMKGSQYERAVTDLSNEAVSIMKKNGGNAAGILRSTKEFDSLVEKVFPNLYDKDFSAVRSAVKVIRDAMNETVDKALPEAVYSSTRNMQSKLITAIENMSEKAVSGSEKELGTTPLSRFGEAIRKHPVLSGAATIVGYEEAKKIPVIGGMLP